LKSFII